MGTSCLQPKSASCHQCQKWASPDPLSQEGGGRGEGEAGKAAEGAEAGEKEGEGFRGLLKLYLVQGRGAQGRGGGRGRSRRWERLKQPKGLWTLQIAEQESWV